MDNFWGLATTAVGGLFGGWLAAYLKIKGENLATKEDFLDALRRLEQNTRTIEEVKATIATGTVLKSELREAVRQFSMAAGGLAHSMCWLTWDCRARQRLNAEMVRNYDSEAHRLSPQIISPVGRDRNAGP